jgi:hypothetical protein
MSRTIDHSGHQINLNTRRVYLSSDDMARKLGVEFTHFREWVHLARDADTPEGTDFREFLIKHYGVDAMTDLELSGIYEEGEEPPTLLEWVEWEVSDILSGDCRGFSRSASPEYGPISGPKIVRYWAESDKSEKAKSWLNWIILVGFDQLNLMNLSKGRSCR